MQADLVEEIGRWTQLRECEREEGVWWGRCIWCEGRGTGPGSLRVYESQPRPDVKLPPHRVLAYDTGPWWQCYSCGLGGTYQRWRTLLRDNFLI